MYRHGLDYDLGLDIIQLNDGNSNFLDFGKRIDARFYQVDEQR